MIFKCFHRSKKFPVEIFMANSTYEAQQRAGKLWNLKPSKWHEISVYLVENDGEPVVHSTAELG
jgi:hypothetical protein